MKKSLVALAALAATSAFAQSSVTIYGNLDQTVYHGSYTRPDGTTASMTGTNSNGGSTSLWGIRGMEDLGGGMRASFDLKSELTLANGQTGSASTTAAEATSNANVFNRGAFISLASNTAGDFKIGRQNNAWWETTTRFNNTSINSFGWANATAMASGTNTVGLLSGQNITAATGSAAGSVGAPAGLATYGTASNNPSATGTGEAFFGGWSYETPSFYGVKAKYGMGISKAAYDQAGANNNVGSWSVSYTQGPLDVAYASTYRDDTNGAKAFKNNMLAVKYIYGQYTFTAAENQTRFAGLASAQDGININALGVGYQFSQPWTLNVGYTTMTDAANSANKFTQIGVVGAYAFSKRTSWYAGYGTGKNEGASRYGNVYGGSGNVIPLGLTIGSGSSYDTGNTVKSFITGIRHQF